MQNLLTIENSISANLARHTQKNDFFCLQIGNASRCDGPCCSRVFLIGPSTLFRVCGTTWLMEEVPLKGQPNFDENGT